jgi:hypothetical protein
MRSLLNTEEYHCVVDEMIHCYDFFLGHACLQQHQAFLH